MAIAISLAAVVVSLSAFLHGRWRDRRDLFLRINEHLVSPDQQHGRRLLYAMKEKPTPVKDLSAEDYLAINNALAALNVLAIYYLRRYVPRKDVLELWALPVLRALLAGDAFLAHRDAQQGTPIWPQLRKLGKDAKQYAQRERVSIQISGPTGEKIEPPVE